MSARRIHLERLLGRVVVDSIGKKVGRIEEIIATTEGLIEEYVLGREGLWERMGVVGLSLIFLGRKRKGCHVPWEKMDLGGLRLKCRQEDL
jgi:sporulation protein YlmC with PRC-barrel domain